ncbi:hypothetical protein QOV31_004738 (plasmid) [Agrobacterium fabrum]|jgi:hypothetical protein|nr:hypothetical protein QOV31_004738 [Agrobacterium fabrum]CAD0216832.1 hypothetical protein AGTUEHA105_LOCUS4761 [Agrobacterium tumefaciens]SDB70799.1 hypothetical protein SAMN03159422_03902 [Agrobacterium fabrum]SER90533.1 hypothetical protein SAMN03159504_03973 [Agrobacterium fabrum]
MLTTLCSASSQLGIRQRGGWRISGPRSFHLVLNTSAMYFFVLDPECARRSRTLHAGYLGYWCTGPYSKAGLVGIDHTPTGYD